VMGTVFLSMGEIRAMTPARVCGPSRSGWGIVDPAGAWKAWRYGISRLRAFPDAPIFPEEARCGSGTPPPAIRGAVRMASGPGPKRRMVLRVWMMRTIPGAEPAGFIGSGAEGSRPAGDAGEGDWESAVGKIRTRSPRTGYPGGPGKRSQANSRPALEMRLENARNRSRVPILRRDRTPENPADRRRNRSITPLALRT